MKLHKGLHCLLSKTNLQTKELQYILENCNMKPLDMHNGISQVYFTKAEGRIH